MEIDVTLHELTSKIDVKFVKTSSEIEADFGETVVVHDIPGDKVYEGDYVVVPKLEPQTMLTKGKVLVEDITVEKIPITKVSNSSGGNTVIIGG